MKPSRILASAQCALVLLSSTFLASAARAEFFVGGSLGSATVAANVEDARFDEDDNSWKVFGGYLFDLAIFDLGIEGGYMDLGSPSNSAITIDTTAIDLFGVIGFDFNIVGLFAKAGVVSWDSDVSSGSFQFSNDGTDPAYGVGIKFAIASLAIRAEYEVFDFKDADDVDMISVGLAWHF